jgi:LysR family glycine cleavage system transcriptional activator
MDRLLPSLNGLRTFEAAARGGSFTEAARELHVTHGAVSRGVQALEAWLGVALFSRQGKRVALTARGRAFAFEVGAALDRLALATTQVTARGGGAVLRIDALPTLTMRWLIPRLPRFQASHPGLEVRLTTSDQAVSGASEDFDVAIRRGPERWPGLTATRFLDERATPVCAPPLAAALHRPQDLSRTTWLHAETRPDDWRAWLQRAHLPRLRPASTLHFDHFYLALQAAQDGLGVAMGPLPLLTHDLASGRLVAPFEHLQTRARSYHALLPRLPRPEAQAFATWLAGEGRDAS